MNLCKSDRSVTSLIVSVRQDLIINVLWSSTHPKALRDTQTHTQPQIIQSNCLVQSKFPLSCLFITTDLSFSAVSN